MPDTKKAIPWPPDRSLWTGYWKNRAWYSGEKTQLAAYADGFWKSGTKNKYHVPVPGELSAMSAAFLFSNSPKITSDDQATDERLQWLLQETGFYQKLLQGAELASMQGGVFLKWNWDKGLAPIPLLSVVPAEGGVPTLWLGVQTANHFWSEQRRDPDSRQVYRLEEAYTRDGNITSRLWKGYNQTLGTVVPLDTIEETKGIQETAKSGTGMLLAVYIPNILPNRSDPFSRLGRSDYDGLQGLFSALDEAYTSMMRDVRLGKSTIIVPTQFLRQSDKIQRALDSSPTGSGMPNFAYDLEQEAYTALDMNMAGFKDISDPIKHIQANIRAEEHQKVIDDIIRRIYMQAGYSPQSAGLEIQGRAESGTALSVRERRSLQTAETKKTYWWHGIMQVVQAMLKLDKEIFKSKINPDSNISVAFADNTQPDQQTLAEIVSKLEAAKAVSVEEKVAMLHPDWTEVKRQEEVGRIKALHMLGDEGMPDPTLGDMEGDPPEGADA